MSSQKKTHEQLLAELHGAQQEVAALKAQITSRMSPKLAEVQARLAAIVESSDDAIISKTLDGIITTWNRGAERIFGFQAEEVIGRAINIIIPPDRHNEEPAILNQLRAGQRVDHFETIRMTRDGRLIDVSVTISPVRDGEGKIVGASKIARNITLQKQIQSELEIAKEAAEQASRAKDHFLSVLSHELRTPLTPVLATLSFLEKQPDLPEELRSQLGMLRRNVETEARLVDDLLDLTRITRGKVKLDQEVVDVHEILRAAIGMMQPEIDNKGLELTTGLRARLHHVWADSGRLQQVFLNLLSNAVKFTPSGGAIAVRTNDDAVSGKLWVEVTDNGLGIGPELRERLFNAFEQSEQSRRQGGLGLGLSIARSLIEMHGGSITASSPGVGAGSTFKVELKTVPPIRAAVAPAGAPATLMERCRVLLVEDHIDTRKVMARLLQSFGCTVTEAASVGEALAAADHADFDVLLSDIGLPDGSGTQIMIELKRRKPIKGIAVSGFGQDYDLQQSRDAGFEMHLIKPISVQTLRDTITRVTAA
ncbi:MAG TPA: PAS domain S-box protein [Tepidisphaeraceae bacterium]|jgi:PAS domain S-box-containing protein|nr:PAS domain S-box protein [Tepidisphaeraceae bacterium]